MNRKTLTAALALAAIGLTACNDHGDRVVNSGICWNFNAGANGQSAPTPIATADAASPVEDCMRRWAYSLAGARDPADVVANAVVAACGGALTRWNQAALSQVQDTSGGEPMSLTTGQPTTPLAAHAAFAQGRALLYVIEARAGNCAPPPVTNGVPAGTQAP